MTTILLDPTLRRARIVRAAVAVITVSILATLTICAIDLRAANHAAPALPSPRRASKTAGRHPVYGQRSGAARRRSDRAPPVRTLSPSFALDQFPLAAPSVIAFVDPSIKGAVASVKKHASRIATVAMTGLVLGEGGSLIDRIDRDALHAIKSDRVPVVILLQNLDVAQGGWLPERVRELARNRHARSRMVTQLLDRCARDGFGGVHLDLEDLDDDWPLLLPILEDVHPALKRASLELTIDLPSEIDGDLLARISHLVDHIVIMAYDEHDQESAPGPIASDAFVAESLHAAAQRVPPDKLIGGLAIYGYDWVNSDPADPISFADAHTAAKEARVSLQWDPAGNSHFRYSDDEGHHEVWLTDAASIWNQVRIAAGERVHTIAVWRLGGEDPDVWDALSGNTKIATLESVAPEARVDNVGDGPFLSLSLVPELGRRSFRLDRGRIVDERWSRSPSPYLVRRAGIVPNKVALTFDDGPDPQFTPQILDILQREHVPASFFVIGLTAAQHPDLVQRAFAAGHEIGNHSFTHPDVASVGQLRLRLELESTSRLIETLTGRRPLLYRPPSLADIEPSTPEGAAAFARAGQLGYLVIDADIDPRDWEERDADRLAASTIDAADGGGVILLHDGGGDRSTTVRALPAIIQGLRARGVEFVQLSDLANKRRDEVLPLAPARYGIRHVLSHVVLTASVIGMTALRVVLLITLTLLLARMLFVIVAALIAERRRGRRTTSRLLPTATAIVPAFK